MTQPVDTQPPASLGVLFVHGMGTHAQGATLRDMGEPLIEWLKLGNVGIESLELTESRLTPGEGDEPAHVRCELTTADGHTRSWILAEACWSQSFTPPSYARMAFWLIASVPWMLGDYVRGAWRREEERTSFFPLRLRQALNAAYAFAGALLVGPIVLALTALLLVRLIPIASVRKAADRLARLLAASLGDVYVVLATHIDRAAIRDQIVVNHAWLQERCRTTVVVAHSAGSALTHQLLRDDRIAGVKTYITLGEAIWRMKWMADLSRDHGPLRIKALGLAVGGTACIAGGWILLAVCGPSYGIAVAVAVGLGVALHFLSARLVRKHAKTGPIRAEAIDLLRGKVYRWRDYVASSDPVPAGALTECAHASVPGRRSPESDTTPGRSHYQPIGVRNRRSIVLDHTSYANNVEGFVAGVALDLARADTQGPPLNLAITRDELAEGRRARALRTLSLALMRPASLGVGCILAVAVATLKGGFANIGEHVGWVGDAVDALPGTVLDDYVSDHGVGIVVLLVLCVAPWLAAGRAWTVWSRIERARFFAKEKGATRLPRGHLTVAAVWLAGTATAAVATLLLADVTSTWWWLAIALALTGGVVLLCSVATVSRVRDRMYAIDPSSADGNAAPPPPQPAAQPPGGASP